MAIHAERVFRKTQAEERARMARIAAGVSAALIAYELIRFAEGRATLRACAGAH